MKRIIVCAANRNSCGDIAIGIRHFCPLMQKNMKAISSDWTTSEQGFVDQYGVFVTREEAKKIANAANQIKRRCGGDEKQLFSENLY